MPSFFDKIYSSYFKRILQFGHAGNNGTPTATTNIEGGDGVATALNLSDDVLSVKPQNDDGNAMLVKNQGGSNILAVDTTNSKVNVGASQINALTLFKDFGIFDASPVAGSHYMMASMTGLDSLNNLDWTPVAIGTGTNPDASPSAVTSNSHQHLSAWWLLSNNITLDSVQVIGQCNASSTLNFHIMSYDYVSGTGSTAGDLSNGDVHASNGGEGSLSPITVGDDRISTTTLTLDSANIDSGKVVIATIENVGGTDDITAQVICKYHIR